MLRELAAKIKMAVTLANSPQTPTKEKEIEPWVEHVIAHNEAYLGNDNAPCPASTFDFSVLSDPAQKKLLQTLREEHNVAIDSSPSVLTALKKNTTPSRFKAEDSLFVAPSPAENRLFSFKNT